MHMTQTSPSLHLAMHIWRLTKGITVCPHRKVELVKTMLEYGDDLHGLRAMVRPGFQTMTTLGIPRSFSISWTGSAITRGQHDTQQVPPYQVTF